MNIKICPEDGSELKRSVYTKDKKQFKRYICPYCSYYESVFKRDDLYSPNNWDFRYKEINYEKKFDMNHRPILKKHEKRNF